MSLLAPKNQNTDLAIPRSASFTLNTREKKFGILSLPLTNTMKESITKNDLSNLLINEGRSSSMEDLSQYPITYLRFLREINIQTVSLPFYENIQNLISSLDDLDGIMLTGGDTHFELSLSHQQGQKQFFKVVRHEQSLYLQKIKMIVDYAKIRNDLGRPFEIYGICLGFEGLLLAESDFDLPLAKVDRFDLNHHVIFVNNASKQEHGFDDDESSKLAQLDIMYYYHEWGFTTSDLLSNPKLTKNYSIDAIYRTEVYGDCVAMVTHKRYPFTAVQFHPEKVVYEESTAFKLNTNKKIRRIAQKFSHVLANSNSPSGMQGFVWNNQYKEYEVNQVTKKDGKFEALLENIGVHKYLMIVSSSKSLL